ncbi:hypothetical protein HK104_011274 [Borealophlyctis nickersoniae]|nr:hypothetical protein HK104_011274 [Borealophlyctis nickersoniae]
MQRRRQRALDKPDSRTEDNKELEEDDDDEDSAEMDRRKGDFLERRLPPRRKTILKTFYPELVCRFAAGWAARWALAPLEAVVAAYIVNEGWGMRKAVMSVARRGNWSDLLTAAAAEVVIGWVVLEGVWGIASSVGKWVERRTADFEE